MPFQRGRPSCGFSDNGLEVAFLETTPAERDRGRSYPKRRVSAISARGCRQYTEGTKGAGVDITLTGYKLAQRGANAFHSKRMVLDTKPRPAEHVLDVVVERPTYRFEAMHKAG